MPLKALLPTRSDLALVQCAANRYPAALRSIGRGIDNMERALGRPVIIAAGGRPGTEVSPASHMLKEYTQAGLLLSYGAKLANLEAVSAGR